MSPSSSGGGEYLLGDRELSEVVANHLRLDLNLVELLAGVDADDAANHLGDNDHVTEVGLDEVGLLVGLSLLLSLAELLDQAHGLALEAAVDPATSTGVDDIAELIGAKVEETAQKRLLSAHVAFMCHGALRAPKIYSHPKSSKPVEPSQNCQFPQ